MERLGPYIIEGELGRGGMGVVYRARHESLAHEVALKVIGGAAGSSAAAAETVADEGTDGPGSRAEMLLARFRREAQAAGRLAGHPGIVGVHDVGVHPEHGTLYLAMELIDGRSLDAVIEEGDLGVDEAARIFARVAEAVDHAHQHGVLHRDLKPGNILLTKDGVPKVTDFGLAKSREASPEVTRLTQAGELVGTPAYMAPEQVRGLGVDVRTDVYALGVSLYETLAGRTPFEGESVYNVVAQVVRDDPPPLRSIAPHVPAALEAIVETCLHKAPDRRYPTAAALAQDLERFQHGEPVAARRTSPLARWWSRRGRSLAVAGVLVGAGVGGVWWLAVRHSESTAEGRKAIDETQRARTHAEQAAALSSAWLATSRHAVPAMRRLQNAFYGGSANLDEFDDLVAEVRRAAAAGPEVTTAAGWGALAELYQRRDGAWDRLDALASTHADDPLLQVLAAHGALAQFADALTMPFTEFTPGRSLVHDYTETEAMIQWRERAAAALDRAAASPLWPLLGQRDTVVAYASGCRAMARSRFIEASAELAPLADDPLFGDEAGALAAFAALHAGDAETAARYWEGVGRRGWTPALLRASLARMIVATNLAAAGGSPIPHLERGLKSAQAAEAIRPDDAELIGQVGTLHWGLALHRIRRGEDATASLQSAIETFERAADAGPIEIGVFLNLAGARKSLARQRAGRGIDPRPELRLAVAEMSAGLSLDPRWHSARRVLSDIWVQLARFDIAYGDDPFHAFEQARAAIRVILDKSPDDVEGLIGLSNVWRAQAESAEVLRESPEAAIAAGLTPIERVLELRPNDVGALSNAAILWRLQGEWLRKSGRDPSDAFRRALERCNRGLELDPADVYLLNNRALMHRSYGDVQRLGGGGDPAPHYRAAIADLSAAMVLRPNEVVPLYNRGVNFDLLAAVLEQQGGDPAPDRERALADFNVVIATNPKMWQALLVRGHLLRRMGRPDEALADYQATLKVNDKIQEARDAIRRIEQGR